MTLLVAHCATSTETAEQAKKQGVHSPYIGEVVVFDPELDAGPIHVHTSYSTARTWVKQDVGYKRISNIAAWCGDYDEARALYDAKFGEGNWKIVWSNELNITRKLYENLEKKYIQ